MSRKRSLMPDVYNTRKRVCVAAATTTAGSSQSSQSTHVNNNHTNPTEWTNGDSANHKALEETSLLSDTNCALMYIKKLFPVDKFEGRLPPIILKHQLYGVLHRRTVVDQQLTMLRNSGEVKFFKLGAQATDLCVVFTQDYKEHVRKFTQQLSINKSLIEKFISLVIDHCQDVSLSQQKMLGEFKFKDEDITQLVRASVLTVRDVGSWWLAIPNAGIFMKSFMRGRKAALTMIRKCKYKEIRREELKNRKLPRIAKLGMEYHIHDIIGADLVACIPTTAGVLLRLQE